MMNTIPLIDPAGDVWDSFICPAELAALKDIVKQSCGPMLAMDAAIPLDLSDRFIGVLNILTGTIYVSVDNIHVIVVLTLRGF